jgi:hypothetical protein
MRSKSCSRAGSRRSNLPLAAALLLVCGGFPSFASDSGLFSGLLSRSKLQLACEARALPDGRVRVEFRMPTAEAGSIDALIAGGTVMTAIDLKVYRKTKGLAPLWRFSGYFREERSANRDPLDGKYEFVAGSASARRIRREDLAASLLGPLETPRLLAVPGEYTLRCLVEIRPLTPRPPLTLFAFFFPLGAWSSGWLRADAFPFSGSQGETGGVTGGTR